MHNKIDLDGQPARRAQFDGETHLWLSARSGEGLPLLIETLKAAAEPAESTSGDFSARARHVAALQRAAESLEAARLVLTTQRAGELAAEELRNVQRELGAITGEFSNEDLLGRIFADFCIGK